MSYTPPAGDQAGFRLRQGYSPPPGDQAGFALELADRYEVVGAVDCVYAITMPVERCHVLPYGISAVWVDTGVHLDYGISGGYPIAKVDIDWHYYIQAVTTITLPESSDVLNSTAISWRNAWQIARPVTIAWDGYGVVVGAVDVGWSSVSDVIGDTALVWNLESNTPVIKSTDLLWSATPTAAQVPISISVAYDEQAAWFGTDLTGSGAASSPAGQPGISGTTGSGAAAGVVGGTVSAGLSSIISANLRFDRREYACRATLTLADPAEYFACPVGTAVEFALGVATCRYRVVDRSRGRSDLASGGFGYTLHLASPAAWLDKPYARAITAEVDGMASTIATGLSAPLDIDWQTVDWPITADLLPVDNSTPLDLLRTIAGAVGGVVVSEPDGSLTIEPEYPVSLPDWVSATPDYYIDEAEEVFTASEDEDQREIINAVLISNESGSGNQGTISIEVGTVEGDEALRELRVYTVPYNQYVTMRHTDGPDISLSLAGVETRTETQFVEIVEGQGSLQYPVVSVDSYTYKTHHLGAITAEEGGAITTALAAESLVEITYTTRCKVWKLASPLLEPVQVVAETIDHEGNSSGLSVLVTRGDGDKRGADIFDQLITNIEVARERGRNVIDAGCSTRAMVQLSCPLTGLMRPGALVEVRDMEIPAWRGLLNAQEIRLIMGETLTAESILELEREVI